MEDILLRLADILLWAAGGLPGPADILLYPADILLGLPGRREGGKEGCGGAAGHPAKRVKTAYLGSRLGYGSQMAISFPSFFILMTDGEVNYLGMARNVLQLLTDQRPAWENVYKKLLPDYTALQTALAVLDEKIQQRSGLGSQGYTDAKDQAEVAVLDAAMPVVQGLKALYLDGGHADLGKAAAYTRSGLDDMRGLPQVVALENLYTTALPLAAALAEEQVTAEQLQALHDRTAAYKSRLGAARQQITGGSALREAAVQHLAEARQALARLDVRVPNLQSTLPELVAAYEKARVVVDAGHGAKKAATATPVVK